MMKSAKVNLQPAERRKGEEPLKPISVNVVYATETHPKTEAVLEWILITTEDISTFEQAKK